MRDLKKRLVQLTVYLSILLLAYTSVCLSLFGVAMQVAEGILLTRALEVATIQVLQGTTSTSASTQRDKAQQKARKYSSRAKYDHLQAIRSGKRSQVAAIDAQKQHHQADLMWHKVYTTDMERLSLLHDIHEQLQHEQQLEDEMRESQIHPGLCSLHGIQGACLAVGQMAALEADQTAVKLHQNYVALAETRRIEGLEQMAAQSLEETADKSDHTVQTLQNTAAHWLQREAADQQAAAKWNSTASALAAQSVPLQGTMMELLHQAHQARNWAVGYFAAAMLTAILVVCFLVSRVVLQVVAAKRASRPLPQVCAEWLSVALLHCLFFVVAATCWCHDTLPHLELYPKPETRAVLLFYFGCLAGVAQTVGLHLLPRIVIEWNRGDELGGHYERMRYVVQRAVLLVPLFAMEFLLVWLSSLRGLLLIEYNSFWMHVMLLGGLVLYGRTQVVGADQRNHHVDDGSTVWTAHDEDSHEKVPQETERAPLVKGLNDQELVDSLYASHSNRETTDGNRDGLSLYKIHFQQELSLLLLLAEMFVLFCMALILFLGLESLFARWVAYLGIAGLAIMIALWTRALLGSSSRLLEAPPTQIVLSV